jgi:hypothetical protein
MSSTDTTSNGSAPCWLRCARRSALACCLRAFSDSLLRFACECICESLLMAPYYHKMDNKSEKNAKKIIKNTNASNYKQLGAHKNLYMSVFWSKSQGNQLFLILIMTLKTDFFVKKFKWRQTETCFFKNKAIF